MALFRRFVSVAEAASVIRDALAADPRAPLSDEVHQLLSTLHRRESGAVAPR